MADGPWTKYAAPPVVSGPDNSGPWTKYGSAPAADAQTVPAAGSQQMQDQVAQIGGGGAYMTPAEVQEYANRSLLSLTPVGGWSRGLERAGQAANDLANRATNLLGLGDRAAALGDTLTQPAPKLSDLVTGQQQKTYTDYLRDHQQKSAEAAARTGGAGTVADLAGTGVASSAVLPQALLSGGTSLVGKIGYGMLGGGLTGAVGGAAQTPADASNSDMVNNAIQGAGFGAVTGAAVPAVLGGVNAALAPSSGSAGQDALAAANRLGISMPNIAASDSPAFQRLGQGVAGTPFGTAVPTALQKGIGDVGTRLGALANDVGNPAVPSLIGGNLRADLTDFVKNGSQVPVKAAYTARDALVPPGAMLQPSNTDQILQTIEQQRSDAGLTGLGRGMEPAAVLASQPGGVVPAGFQRAKSTVGRLANTGLISEGYDQGDLKQLGGAMAQDQNDFYASISPQVDQAQQAANALYQKTLQRNQDLTDKLLGPGKSDEQLFSTVVGAAQNNSRANAKLLLQVKSAVPTSQWNDFSASLINNMGQDNTGQFSPAKFLSQYSNLTDIGKNTLLSAAQRSTLDDLAKVSLQYKNLSKLANTSNTGNVNAVVRLMLHPVYALGEVFGGGAMAHFMAKPAAVKSISNWSQSYGNFMAGPTMQAAKSLQSQTKNLAVTLATQLGDARQAPQIEQSLLNMNPLQTQQPVQPDDQAPQLATAP